MRTNIRRMAVAMGACAALATAGSAWAQRRPNTGASHGESESKPDPKKADGTALAFKVKDIDGNEQDLSQYMGKVVLIVNTASKCGYTPQYARLEELYEKYATQGFVILGFPCNDFGGQEPGSESDIKQFCKSNFGVQFPMFAKVKVKGEAACELYKFLTSKQTNPKFAGDITWNFNKFLLNRDGQIVGRYKSSDDPVKNKHLIEDLEKALGGKTAEKKM